MKKIYIINVLWIFLLACISLSANTTLSNNNDSYTGLYYVHGSKIVTYYRCPFIELCGPDDGPFTDSTRIASVVAVKWVADKTDSLHFFGLPGAGEGETKNYFGKDLLRDHASSLLNYDVLSGYKLYGFQTDGAFTIQYSRAGFLYDATGSITGNTLIIEGEYVRRTTTVKYDLFGERILTLD